MLISKISVPEPCPESWDKMHQTQKGKFCDLCSKEVIDFTKWTDSEVIQYFENARTNGQTNATSKIGTTCGRLSTQQVERINQILQNHTSQQPNLWRIFAWAFSVTALSSVVALQNVNAAEKPVNQEVIRNITNENIALESEEKWQSIATNTNIEIVEILQGEVNIKAKVKKKQKLTFWQRIRKIKLF